MKTKDEIQKEIINKIIDSNFKGIVLSSVRSGKTRILLQSIQKHFKRKNIKVLLLYPNVDIKNSWENECDLIGFHPDITYCTFASISKIKQSDWDYVIVD